MDLVRICFVADRRLWKTIHRARNRTHAREGGQSNRRRIGRRVPGVVRAAKPVGATTAWRQCQRRDKEPEPSGRPPGGSGVEDVRPKCLASTGASLWSYRVVRVAKGDTQRSFTRLTGAVGRGLGTIFSRSARMKFRPACSSCFIAVVATFLRIHCFCRCTVVWHVPRPSMGIVSSNAAPKEVASEERWLLDNEANCIVHSVLSDP